MTSNQSYFRILDAPRNILIEGAKVVITDDSIFNDCSIFISERKIVAIGDKTEILKKYGTAEETIDGRQCLVMPGFINNHSHIAMALLRGLAEDLPLFSWLRDRIWPIEAKLKPWQIEVGAAIGVAESLLSGTTSVTSMYIFDETGSEASAIDSGGMRGVIGHGVFDWTEETGLSTTQNLASKFHGKDEGRIRVAIAPHSAYSCSPELLKKLETLRCELNARLGKEFPIVNTIHSAESLGEASEIEKRYKVEVRTGVINYLRTLGVLNFETICAHAIHLLPEDYDSLVETGASIASCPISNLKVGEGVANLPKAITKGVVVSLGTDGPASNNSLDMFQTTKMASLLAKGMYRDPRLLDSKQVFLLATSGGARSLHRENELGKIKQGCKADLVLLDLSNVSSIPFFDPYNFVVFSAQPHDVKHVIVDGRIVVRDRQILTIDIPKLRERVSVATDEITSEFGRK